MLDNKKPIQHSTIVHFSNHEGANTRLNFLFENFNQNWPSSISANLFSVSVIHPKPSVFPPSRLPTLKKNYRFKALLLLKEIIYIQQRPILRIVTCRSKAKKRRRICAIWWFTILFSCVTGEKFAEKLPWWEGLHAISLAAKFPCFVFSSNFRDEYITRRGSLSRMTQLLLVKQ